MKAIYNILILFIVIGACPNISFGQDTDSEKIRILFIFDASNSMNAQLQNGSKMTIGDSYEILDLGEEKEAEETEASEEELSEETTEDSKEEELAEDDEADVEDWAGMEKRIKNLEDAVADLKADKVEASAEVSEEVEDKTEMSKEVMGELMTQVEELKEKIVELSGEPATEGIKYNPEGSNFNSTMDLTKLSAKERAAYYINNK